MTAHLAVLPLPPSETGQQRYALVLSGWTGALPDRETRDRMAISVGAETLLVFEQHVTTDAFPRGREGSAAAR